MRRFFVQEITAKESSCTITGSEARHITKALRLGRGDRIILLDGQGVRFQGIIESIAPQRVEVRLEKPLPKPPDPPVEITICQALLKSQAMDLVIEKTSELGIHSVQPFTSERTVVKLDESKSENKTRRWREISYGAATQSDGRGPAEIGPLVSFNDLLTTYHKEDALKVIFWEEEDAKDFKRLLRASSPMKKAIGIVGPEGGFTRKEIQMAEEAGFTSVSLGQRVLRAETAAIAMTTIIQYEWGDLSLPNP